MSGQSTLRNPFLDLPLEIRLLIYGYTIVQSEAVTISSALLTGECADIVERQYGNGRSPFPGLPCHHEPVILPGYSSHLLSLTDPPRIHVSRAPAPEGLGYLDAAWQSPLKALRLVSTQVNDELVAHFRTKSSRDTSLFVSYPHGLHVFQTLCPDMIRQAKSVHISGNHYAAATLDRPMAASTTCSASSPSDEAKISGADSVEQLSNLIRSTLGPNPVFPIAKLEMRMYFPTTDAGMDSYRSVWGDDNSPICVVLRNISSGFIDMECWRGTSGNGVHLSVRPHPANARIITSVWRRLQEGGRGEPKAGAWAVDDKWPHWSEEYVASPPTP